MRRYITIYLLSSWSLMLFQNCTLTKKSRYNKYKLAQLFQIQNRSLSNLSSQFDQGSANIRKNSKSKGHTDKSVGKMRKNESLKHKIVADIDAYLAKSISYFRKGGQVPIFATSKGAYHAINASGLKKELDEYSSFIQKNFSKHLTNTTSWSRRYIKQLPPEQQKNPPSFAEFYFKGASQEEALVVLSTLQLGILQEALEIQEKILKE